ncbi:unknown [Clostridium sp. CAG:448]|nr:unknown [Clostridium sp. CAG:448]
MSVIGADSGVADFLSTALLILPDDRAETLLSRYPDVWVLLVDADGTVVTKGEQAAAQP